MQKYKSLPSECMAEQFGGFYATPYPEGVEMEDNSNDAARTEMFGRYAFYVITTHGQRAYLQPGDWVVREPNGNGYYPVKPEIFEKRWTPAQAPIQLMQQRFTGEYLCDCQADTPCPLGKKGVNLKCTEKQLLAAGIPCKRPEGVQLPQFNPIPSLADTRGAEATEAPLPATPGLDLTPENIEEQRRKGELRDKQARDAEAHRKEMDRLGFDD